MTGAQLTHRVPVCLRNAAPRPRVCSPTLGKRRLGAADQSRPSPPQPVLHPHTRAQSPCQVKGFDVSSGRSSCFNFLPSLRESKRSCTSGVVTALAAPVLLSGSLPSATAARIAQAVPVECGGIREIHISSVLSLISHLSVDIFIKGSQLPLPFLVH